MEKIRGYFKKEKWEGIPVLILIFFSSPLHTGSLKDVVRYIRG